MSVKRKAFELLIWPFCAGMRYANAVTVRLAQASQPIFTASIGKSASLRFLCPNPVTLWRAKTLLTKEPDTIKWIQNFAEEAIFFDVGANIGVYSLYAASMKAKVYSFEPEAQNYALLNRNIELNRLQNRVTAFNFALNRKFGLELLQVSSTEVGNALHSVGDHPSPYSTSPAPFRQGIASYSLDQLVYDLGLPPPNHIKIDVDGIEPDIISGASKILADDHLRTLLVELDETNVTHQALVPKIQAFGLNLISKKACPLATGTQFETVFNHIFSRLPEDISHPIKPKS